MQHLKRLVAVCVLLLLIVPLRAQTTLTVFAAASLTDAFTEIGTAFEAATPGVTVIFNFAGSANLVAQLAEGAPADVFASANARQMQAAADAGRIGGQPRTFVRNRLVVAYPADNPAGIRTLADLGQPGIKLVIAAPEVPVRDYTNTMVERLSAPDILGTAFSSGFFANVVSEEPNVRQVVAKIALGEADAGIVYVSDITPDVAAAVDTLPIPDQYNTLATYPLAVTDNPTDAALAQAFVDFMLGDAGQAILTRWNFISILIPEQPPTVTLPATGTTVDGQVLNVLNLTPARLQADFPAVTLADTRDNPTVPPSYTGARLWDVLNAAQPNLNADLPQDKLRLFLVITGRAGDQAVIAWGEIDPELGNQPVLLAYAVNAAPLPGAGLRLIVPGDQGRGRWIVEVANISLRAAPPAR